jgi:prepilin-type N-terminal cleavage/methylation domain-containing protein
MVAAARGATARQRGFALAELMISTSIFSMLTAGLLIGFIALKRNYAATMDFATNHGDQMRISDYLALDFRRAIAVSAAQNDTTVYIAPYYAPRVPGQLETARAIYTPVIDGRGHAFYGTTPQVQTTAALPTCTYTDFTAAGPAKLRGTTAGPLVINGYAVGLGDTVFVRNQSVEAQNGLYNVTNSGSTGSWTLTAQALKVRYYLSGSTILREQEGEPNQPTALATDVQDFVFEASDLGKVIKTSITFKPTFRAGGASEDVKKATAFYNTTLIRNNRGVY